MKRSGTVILAVVAAILLAVAARAQSLSNFSARMDMTPGGTYTIGLVVPGTTPVALLLRAVGPSLKQFGVTNPVAAPAMQVYDATGEAVFFNYPLPAGPIVSLPPGTQILEETTLPTDPYGFLAAFASVGAFLLSGGEQPLTAYNFGTFRPGVYTVRLTDTSGKGGTLLFETYVLSGAIAARALPVAGTDLIGVSAGVPAKSARASAKP